MDNLRGSYFDADRDPYESSDDHDVMDATPPSAVGQDERRMQVRAYNFWAGLLEDRNFPSIEDLDPENLPDFGPNSVLLDFTGGVENPAIPFLGAKIAAEYGNREIEFLDDVPSRSLLSRITDHYMQILANQAPIGFEAEFVNDAGNSILYRGILLPFSSDDEAIDFIYGVINWKELADQDTTDALMIEVDQALELAVNQEIEEDLEEPFEKFPPAPDFSDDQIESWADGPAADRDDAGGSVDPHDDVEDTLPKPAFGLQRNKLGADDAPADDNVGADAFVEASEGEPLELGSFLEEYEPAPIAEQVSIPAPYDAEPSTVLPDTQADNGFASDGAVSADDVDAEEPEGDEPNIDEPAAEHALELTEVEPETMGLADWLASARELAQVAKGSEERTRSALYSAIGRAYDFSLAAQDDPANFADIVEDAGLAVQDRAPMTPVVKLVFGADYDKTRLTEYAAALSHGHRKGVARGQLSTFLAEAKGGLKGVVREERKARREEQGKDVETEDGPRAALANQLRELEAQALESLESDGAEFALLMVRREADGTISLLGEVPEDVPLVERAARKLLG